MGSGQATVDKMLLPLAKRRKSIGKTNSLHLATYWDDKGRPVGAALVFSRLRQRLGRRSYALPLHEI